MKLVAENNKEPGKVIEENIKTLLNIREVSRKEKDWKKADEIRDKLQEIGVDIEDTIKGPVWKKKIEV